MKRYFHIADRATCAAVKDALNARALPPPGARMVTRVVDGVQFTVRAAEEEARLGLAPEAYGDVIAVDDEAVFEVPEVARAHMPPGAELVEVSRAREHAKLPSKIRDALDDAYVREVFDGKESDDAGALGKLNGELQARAAAALARLIGERQRAAVERALGNGKKK